MTPPLPPSTEAALRVAIAKALGVVLTPMFNENGTRMGGDIDIAPLLTEKVLTAVLAVLPKESEMGGETAGEIICVSPTTGVRAHHRRYADGTFNTVPFKTEYPKQ